MNCFKKPEEEIDPSLLAKYAIKVDELSDLMQLRGAEALDKIKTKYGCVDEITRLLKTNQISGLSGDPSEISEREKVFGRNEIPPKSPKTFLRLAFEASQDTTLIVLMICAILSIGLSFYHPPSEETAEDQKQAVYEQNLEWVEGVAIFIAVIVVVLVTAINDWRKEKQFRGLQSRIEKENLATVVRSGQVTQINVKDLVVGDICCIKYGDLLPADGLVVQSNDLKIDESSLTGETDLIKKNEHTNMTLLSGTHVMEGSGKFLVCAVGVHSQCGIIYVLLGATKEDKKKDEERQKKRNEPSNTEPSNSKVGPEPVGEKDGESGGESGSTKHRSVLQAKLTSLSIQIGYVGTIAAIFTFLMLCIRLAIDEFVIAKRVWTNSYFKYIISYLIQGITVLVVSVPEGLPLAVTLSLAYAVKKMTKDNNLVRHLDACETMGSATTICSDKTGTLTTNRMTVVQCYIGEKLCKTLPPKHEVNSVVKKLVADAVSINSNYTSKLELPKQQGDLPKQCGNKTECGLLGFVAYLGENYDDIRREHPVESFIKVNTFNSARKMMSTVVKNGERGFRLYAKGASEIVLQKCAYMLNGEGRAVPIDANQIQNIIKNVVENMALDGLRTICVAYRDFVPVDDKSSNFEPNSSFFDGTPDWDDEDSTVRNLTCICLVGIEDPVRDEVPDAIKKCQKSGVVVRMITGDNINTATSIATKCGIIKPGDNFLILESKDFNARIRNSKGDVSQALLDKVWPNLRVLARSTPQDKYILVNGIVESKTSENREVVAVTGDGTNDGPALKRADVGFAMGIQGTDVAKEASDIILTDDNFSSIVKAMMWGRNVYDSIAKFLQFQLTANLTAGVLSIVCAATIRAVPLKAIQMLWVNLVMDTLGSLALATEPPTEKLLERKPYGRTKPILSPGLVKMIVGHGVYQLIIIFALVWGIEEWLMVESVVKYNDINRLKENNTHFTMIFNAFVLMTLFNEINARKLYGDRNVIHNIHKNAYFYVIWIGSFIAQIFIVQFGSILFSVVALDIHQWIWCVLFGFGTLLWSQLLVSFPTEWVEWLMNRINCKKRVYVNMTEMASSEKANHQNGETPKVMWLRGLTQLNNQFTIISAFQQKLNETYDVIVQPMCTAPSMHVSIKNKSLSTKSLLSLKKEKN